MFIFIKESFDPIFGLTIKLKSEDKIKTFKNQNGENSNIGQLGYRCLWIFQESKSTPCVDTFKDILRFKIYCDCLGLS